MRWVKLLGGCMLLAFVWLWILPRIAETSSVRKHMLLLEERNINAGAMFYTEVQENR
ncbi:MAG: hypothetical protein ACOYKN_12555 [Pirellula sp.]|jgi:hypothetical protein